MNAMRTALVVLIGLLCILGSPIQAVALDPITAGAGVGAIVLGGHTARDIIDQAGNRARELISQATDSGNLLLANAANQLDVLSANIRFELGNELDKRYEELSLERRNLVAVLNTVVENTNRSMDRAVAVTDFVALDLTALLKPFGDLSFFLRRVDGLTVRKRELPYVVKVRGRGVGFQDEGGNEYQLTVEVGGNRLDESAVQTKAQYETDIIIPFNLLNTSFADDRINSVDVKLTSTIKKSSRWWSPSSWFSESPTKSYSSTFNMILTPIKASRLSAQATVEGWEWSAETKSKAVAGKCNHFLYTETVCCRKTREPSM